MIYVKCSIPYEDVVNTRSATITSRSQSHQNSSAYFDVYFLIPAFISRLYLSTFPLERGYSEERGLRVILDYSQSVFTTTANSNLVLVRSQQGFLNLVRKCLWNQLPSSSDNLVFSRWTLSQHKKKSTGTSK